MSPVYDCNCHEYIPPETSTYFILAIDILHLAAAQSSVESGKEKRSNFEQAVEDFVTRRDSAMERLDLIGQGRLPRHRLENIDVGLEFESPTHLNESHRQRWF